MVVSQVETDENNPQGETKPSGKNITGNKVSKGPFIPELNREQNLTLDKDIDWTYNKLQWITDLEEEEGTPEAKEDPSDISKDRMKETNPKAGRSPESNPSYNLENNNNCSSSLKKTEIKVIKTLKENERSTLHLQELPAT